MEKTARESKASRAKAIVQGRLLKEKRLFTAPSSGSDSEWGYPSDRSATEDSDGSCLKPVTRKGSSTLYFSDEMIHEPYQIGSAKGIILENVARSIVNLEQKIAVSLRERALYPHNREAYNRDALPVLGFDGSFVEFLMKQTELLCCKVGKYEGYEELPFFSEVLTEEIVVNAHQYDLYEELLSCPGDLPDKVPLSPLSDRMLLHPCAKLVNPNEEIWDFYFYDILPKLVYGGSDGNAAMSSSVDITILQAISKRLNAGKLLAEAKFQQDPDKFESAIRSQDAQKLEELLHFSEPEDVAMRRAEIRSSLDQEIAEVLYDWLLTTSKRMETNYLLKRLDPSSP